MMRRVDREESERFARELFATCDWSVLSTTGPDGPYAVPVSHVVEGNRIYFHCALEGTKLDCIEFDKRVSLTCVGHVEPDPAALSLFYRSAIARGNASIVTDEQEKQHALKLIVTRHAPSNSDHLSEHIAQNMAMTCVVCVTVTHYTAKARKKKNVGPV